jgi:hypothetical protein
VAGSLYIYFAFLRSQLRAMKGTPRMALETFDRFSTWAESLGALALGLFVVLRWILPSVRPPLQFSGPEVQFLFTAPVPRRRLLHYKLLRGQIGLLFTSLVALLFGGRAAPSRLSFVLGLFLLLSTLRLHMMGVVLSRASLTQPGGRRRPGAWLPLGLTVGASVVIVLGLGIGLVSLLEYRDSSFRTDDEVVSALTLPVVAIIPLMLSASERQKLRRRARVVGSAVAVAVIGLLGAAAWIWWSWR